MSGIAGIAGMSDGELVRGGLRRGTNDKALRGRACARQRCNHVRRVLISGT